LQSCEPTLTEAPSKALGKPTKRDAPKKWCEVPSSTALLQALGKAGDREAAKTQVQKKEWSKRFADGCARMIAAELSRRSLFKKKKKRISPGAGGGTELLMPLGAGTSKRIDVTVADPLLGLEIGVSLKGLNFRDEKNGNYDKNLTGRLYELADEVRLVHEYLPRALMVGIFFIPLGSTGDKLQGISSFAKTVMMLRQRAGRQDPHQIGQASLCDMGFVGLYSLGDEDGYERGQLLFFDVEKAPPRRGRPRVQDMFTLGEMVGEIEKRATLAKGLTWGIAEEDTAPADVPVQGEIGEASPEEIVDMLGSPAEDETVPVED